MRRCICFVLPFALVAVSLFSGCGGEDDPAAPESTVGTIIVNPSPGQLEVSWNLTGPGSYNHPGTGDETLTDLALGEYTLTWDSVTGWVSPSNSTQNLVASGTLTFNGIYFEDPGQVQGFVLIPPDAVPMPTTFTMGSTVFYDETPHQVTLTGRFYMTDTEVTNAQYVAALQWAFDEGHVTATTSSVRDALDGSTVELLDLGSSFCQISFNGGEFSTSDPDLPVVEVSWYGSAAYCDWSSMLAGMPRAYDHGDWVCNGGDPYAASGYRLPTEAEWEFACRAGTTTHFNTGDCLDAGDEANYDGGYPYALCSAGPYLGHAASVGSYPANLWGLFDMHGNVWEWCNDWYGYYTGDETDPAGAEAGYDRVLRGGNWTSRAIICRSSGRYIPNPNLSFYLNGFRFVRSVP